jgi:DNA-directed RNA polymerase sigma subunit (sigma70/sigma32)
MFQEGHPTAENLTESKRNKLLIELLDSLEPREAEVVMGIFNKDQGVKGLTYKFVKEAFPNMLP